MKKKLKRIIVLFFSLALIFGMITTVFASIAYTNYYTNGTTYGTFHVTTSESVSQFTVQTQDFPSSSSIAVEVWNSSNTKRLSQSGVWINGNNSVNNQTLTFLFPAGTYTIRYNVYLGGSGWIGVWLY